jgi:hypothetical protein
MAACIEKKLTLSGKTDLYQCELMQLIPGRGVLRYVLEREYSVSGILLFPGDITYALYWPDRPYTLYIWQTRDRGTVYYFNIADSISLTPEMFIWRDLVIDILVADRSHPQVLDEEELPKDLSSGLGAYIRSATSLVLSSYQSVIQESQSVMSDIPAPH